MKEKITNDLIVPKCHSKIVVYNIIINLLLPLDVKLVIYIYKYLQLQIINIYNNL